MSGKSTGFAVQGTWVQVLTTAFWSRDFGQVSLTSLSLGFPVPVLGITNRSSPSLLGRLIGGRGKASQGLYVVDSVFSL